MTGVGWQGPQTKKRTRYGNVCVLLFFLNEHCT